jgi:hypothetical protein
MSRYGTPGCSVHKFIVVVNYSVRDTQPSTSGALKRHLARPDVVERLDALTGVGGVLEEQRQAQTLVDMLGSGSIGVDDLLMNPSPWRC